MELEPAPPPDIKMSKSQRTINKGGKKLSNKNTKKLHTVKEITANSYSINRHKKFPLQRDA